MNKDWVDLSSLPRRKSYIDWKKSIGFEVCFQYKGIQNKFKILELIKAGRLKILYDSREVEVRTNSLTGCDLRFAGRKNFKFSIGQTLLKKNQNLIIVDRVYGVNESCRFYLCKCSVCNAETYLSESHLRNSGCPVCHGKRIAVGVNDIPHTEPWMVKYFPNGEKQASKYTKNSQIKLNFVCPFCGTIKKNKISIQKLYQRRVLSCECGDGFSFPEKVMLNLLKQLNISFIYQFFDDWCFYYRNNVRKKCYYDFEFEINGVKYIVEMDGGFHYSDSNVSKLKDVKEIDDIKDCLAKDNGYKIIRVNCKNSDFDFIKNSLIESLGKIIRLDVVDWSDILKKSLNNLVKEVCDMFESDTSLTCTDVAKKMGLSISCVSTYLKKGKQVGFTSYTKQSLKNRVDKKRYYNRIQPIALLENDKVVAIFEKSKDLIASNDGSFFPIFPCSKLYNFTERCKLNKSGFRFVNVDKLIFKSLIEGN